MNKDHLTVRTGASWVTPEVARRKLKQHLQELSLGEGRQVPNSGLTDTCTPVRGWETLALTKGGSPKRVKDTGELTELADMDAPQEKLDTPTGFLGMWDIGRAFLKGVERPPLLAQHLAQRSHCFGLGIWDFLAL